MCTCTFCTCVLILHVPSQVRLHLGSLTWKRESLTLVENRSVLSDSGCQGVWASGNGKCISNAVRLPGLMPTPCFQTIQASRVFEQRGSSGIRIPHPPDSASILGPGSERFLEHPGGGAPGSSSWVRAQGETGKPGAPHDTSSVCGRAPLVSPRPASQGSPPATPRWPQLTPVKAVPLPAGCHQLFNQLQKEDFLLLPLLPSWNTPPRSCSCQPQTQISGTIFPA